MSYPCFSVTADILVFTRDAGTLKILLVQRRNPPFKGKWALPGGFLSLSEDALSAARRELREETGLVLPKSRLKEVGSFSAPKRDPRGRTVTIAFATLPPVNSRQSAAVKAGDDARDAKWFSVKRLPRLAFDHRDIIRRALSRYRAPLLGK